MTDQELLELAAKAAGIPLKSDFKERFDYYMQDRLMWNPLQDDGDALCLAVKLRMEIEWTWLRRKEEREQPAVMVSCEGMAIPCLGEPTLDNPYAATRRAIVRAAAEIGRAMG